MSSQMELISNLQHDVRAALADARDARAMVARLEGQLAAQAAETQRATAAERTRIRGILTGPEAEGRTVQAQALAFESAMDETLAAKILAAQPKEAGTNRLKTIAERAAEQGSAGGGGDFIADRRQSGGDPMAKAVQKINAEAQIGHGQK